MHQGRSLLVSFLVRQAELGWAVGLTIQPVQLQERMDLGGSGRNVGDANEHLHSCLVELAGVKPSLIDSDAEMPTRRNPKGTVRD